METVARTIVTSQVPTYVADLLRAKAARHERSLSAEIRLALLSWTKRWTER